MAKKKILIVSHAMELGGAERSLLGLLDAMDPEQYAIDLFLLRHEGELMPHIPDYVNLLPSIPAYTVLARPMVQTLKEGHVLLTFARLLGKLAARVYDKRHSLTESGVALEYSHKFTCPLMPKIQPDVTYDLAISFLTPHYFVAEKVRARKKIAWIHTDYSKVRVNAASETAMWAKYDHIMSISDAVTESFEKVFPRLSDRIVLMENILPGNLVRHQAEAGDVSGDMPGEMPGDGSVRLLSIGRFCNAKNFDNVPDICARLRSSGLNVKWYLIGFGGDENLIRQRIAQSGMEKHVIILGKKENPYPYIKACDLYVQPSRYEGKSVTVREAQLLGKPVVITNYLTAKSQLTHGVDGIIVPMENGPCAEGLAAVLRDKALMERLAENCRQRDYTNAAEVEKIGSLLPLEGDNQC